MESTRPASGARQEIWVRAAPVLVLLQLALAGALWARLGPVALYLWYLGPSGLALLSVAGLAAALLTAMRRRVTWDLRHAASALALALVAGAVPFYRAYPSSHDAHPSTVPVRLPLDGPVTILWGGPREATNYHVVLPDQRWAYDLVVTEDGKSFRNDGRSLSDYLIYQRVVHAPADGVVVTVVDGLPETPAAQGRRFRRPSFGNHVVLEVAPQEFLFVAHLHPGSVTVRVGDRVKAGQELGCVGNSGTSSEPHVHMHLQDTSTPFFGEGIPILFTRYRQGGVEVDRGMPLGGIADGRFIGDVVEQLEATSTVHAPRQGP
jgi:hypothetical protein